MRFSEGLSEEAAILLISEAYVGLTRQRAGKSVFKIEKAMCAKALR